MISEVRSNLELIVPPARPRNYLTCTSLKFKLHRRVAKAHTWAPLVAGLGWTWSLKMLVKLVEGIGTEYGFGFVEQY